MCGVGSGTLRGLLDFTDCIAMFVLRDLDRGIAASSTSVPAGGLYYW